MSVIRRAVSIGVILGLAAGFPASSWGREEALQQTPIGADYIERQNADARIQAAAIGGIAATASHSFGIVTPEGVSLADANISETQVFSFGPSGSPLNPGTTVAQPSGSPINRADRAATEQLIEGGGVGMQVNINGLSAGGTTVLSATEVTGVTNEQAIAAFSAPTSGQAYSAIPGANSSNSNTEIGNRVRSISPDFKKPDFPVTPGFE